MVFMVTSLGLTLIFYIEGRVDFIVSVSSWDLTLAGWVRVSLIFQKLFLSKSEENFVSEIEE